MSELQLPRYGLEKYLDQKKLSEATKHDKDVAEKLSRAGARMMGFCKSTFFKRIDSSGYAFLLTLYRHVLRNYVYIYAIENGLPLPVGDENALPDDLAEDADSNEDFINDSDTRRSIIFDVPVQLSDYEEKAHRYYDYITKKNNVTWISSKLFKRTLKQQLKADSGLIIKMIELCGKWNPAEDQKLNQLEILLSQTHKNEKVVVFTQYSDTANYIYNQLKERGIKSIECVTGNSDNQVELVNRFSPISNNAKLTADNELRILIATDVLSEGQNLQDAHIVVNFDLPWAIIRLIQRAGRVDRIGQEAENIDCYSFFPAEGVENIINLRNRLNQRINENANVMGSDELFFEGNEQNLRDIYNEKSGVLDDEEDTDVDLTSYAYQIWTEATKANPELKSRILKLGNMVDATKETSDAMEEGVVTYARTKSGYDVLSWVDKEGKVISNSQKRILRAMSCAANTPSIPHHENHYELIKDAIKNIQETSISQVSGTLGNRFSTRFKIYDLLDNYYNTKEADLFFTEDKRQQLKIAIDTIFNGQLLEQTKFMLGRMMRSRTSNDEIVDYVLELLRTGNLCKVEEDQLQSNTPSIICSMGIRKQD
jgi:superfamily II DNA/RNA helicase